MFRFFRQIRQKLLLSGSTQKYLIYALGEIFLVVIGILIALQINNWNEHRKEKLKEHAFLLQLQNEFLKDSTSISQLDMLATGKIEQAEYVIQVLKNGNAKIDTNKFIPNVFLIGKAVVFKPFIPTFDELISSGQFDIIQNKKLSIWIRAYLNRLEGLNIFSFQEGSQRKLDYNTHLYKYFSAEIMPAFWESNLGDINFLDDIKNYTIDMDGFRKDPKSIIQTQNVKATDMEMSFLYKQSLGGFIEPILVMLNEELNKQ
jgi:hypothetical protein